MKSINVLMLVIIWMSGHSLVYNVQHYLTEVYVYNIPFILLLFVGAMYLHSRIFTYMTFKILDHF